MRFLGVPREESDPRVALTPEVVPRVTALGLGCLVEEGAGLQAFFSDESYREKGAEVVSRENLRERADLVLVLHEKSWPDPRPGTVLVGMLEGSRPAGVDAFSLEKLPRTTRAQSRDVLSSLATVAGYRAALLAAAESPRFFPMLTTAAGTVPPARVLVLGAGVAGLSAMGTARRLGAVVTGYDIRPAAQEEIKSVGARCLAPPPLERTEGEGGYAAEQPAEGLRRQQEGLREEVSRSHAVIATAAVPGKPAPLLLTREMVAQMPPGSVVVDLAGGNCELTRPGERILHEQVTVLDASNLAARLPISCSSMLARNLVSFVELLVDQGEISIPWQDDLVATCCVGRKE